MSKDELNKIIAVKKMDIEECELELQTHYYPSVVRVAMSNYISLLQKQLELHMNDLMTLTKMTQANGYYDDYRCM